MTRMTHNRVLLATDTGSPFSLDDPRAYQAWRERKLEQRPALDELLVPLENPFKLNADEKSRVLDLCRRCNAAIYKVSDSSLSADKALVHKLGLQFGLSRLDDNLRADEDDITSLRVTEQEGNQYIPYTNKPLSWHTDGYYNESGKQIHGWALYCVRQAAGGGESQLMDHEMLYLMMRDEDPAMISALMQPDAMTIPANREDGEEIRPDHSGPVFSVAPSGHLHMRYSARKRNIIWKDDAATRKARDFITALFRDDSAPMYTYRLEPGEGVVSNNILHRRNAFTDGDTPDKKRLVWRARFHDRIVSNTIATE